MFQNSRFLSAFVLFLSLFSAFLKAEYLSNDECFKALENNPQLEGLKQKVTLSNFVENQNLSLLVDEKKPNEKEKRLLLLWDELRQVCINQDLDNIRSRSIPIELLNVYENKNQKFKFLLVDLYSSKISFGEFNKLRQKINLSSKSEEIQVIENLKKNKLKNQSNSNSSIVLPSTLSKCIENQTSHCFGEWKWNDGSKYVGEFENGKFNGQGTIFNSDGSVKEKGIYVNDYLVSSSQEIKPSPQPSNEKEQSKYKERQKAIDSLNCEVYAKNSTSNQQPAVAYGDRYGITGLLSATLIGMNTQDYYDSCMKRLGY